jgi:hypothetical protein
MRDEISERAFRRALGDSEPDVTRIADAVPAMMAEARRRRARADRMGTAGLLAPLAKRALPRLAAVAAGLVLAAALVGPGDRTATASETTSIDRLVLTGETDAEPSDILLRAIAKAGQDDG